MNIKISRSFIPILFVISLFTSVSLAFFGSYSFDKEKSLKYNKIQVIIDDIQTGGQYTNYFLNVKIKNTGSKEAVFDSGILELVDPDSGLTFYSISKDKSSISVPVQMSNLITTASLKPDRMIAGMLWFTTQPRAANCKKLRLYYGDQFIDFTKK